jgi:hypothetical protein
VKSIDRATLPPSMHCNKHRLASDPPRQNVTMVCKSRCKAMMHNKARLVSDLRVTCTHHGCAYRMFLTFDIGPLYRASWRWSKQNFHSSDCHMYTRWAYGNAVLNELETLATLRSGCKVWRTWREIVIISFQISDSRTFRVRKEWNSIQSTYGMW